MPGWNEVDAAELVGTGDAGAGWARLANGWNGHRALSARLNAGVGCRLPFLP